MDQQQQPASSPSAPPAPPAAFPAMSERERSHLAYGLAGVMILCATLLGGLRVFTAEQILLAYAMALGAVGLIHMPAPRGPLSASLVAVLATGTLLLPGGGP